MHDSHGLANFYFGVVMNSNVHGYLFAHQFSTAKPTIVHNEARPYSYCTNLPTIPLNNKHLPRYEASTLLPYGRTQ